MSIVLKQPLVEIEIVILLRPQHARQGLPVDPLFVFAEILRRYAIVELVGFGQTLGENLVELRERIGPGFITKAQPYDLAATGGYV
jgi:hypothetical protein